MAALCQGSCAFSGWGWEQDEEGLGRGAVVPLSQGHRVSAGAARDTERGAGLESRLRS